MSDYNCWIRTNYFRVKDENALEELLSTCRTNGHLQLRESEEGKKYCFTCDGRIYGVPDREAPSGWRGVDSYGSRSRKVQIPCWSGLPAHSKQNDAY